VKNFASQTLPTLQDHLKNAQDAASKAGVSTAKGKKKANPTSASTSNPQ